MNVRAHPVLRRAGEHRRAIGWGLAVAVLAAGGAYVPLDPGYPAERLAFMAADAAAPVVLTHSRLRERLPASVARVLCVDALPGRLAAAPPVPGAGPRWARRPQDAQVLQAGHAPHPRGAGAADARSRSR